MRKVKPNVNTLEQRIISEEYAKAKLEQRIISEEYAKAKLEQRLNLKVREYKIAANNGKNGGLL